MSSFLTSAATPLDLGSMPLANTPLDGLICTVTNGADLALFLCTVLAAAAALLGEAVTSAGSAAIDMFLGIVFEAAATLSGEAVTSAGSAAIDILAGLLFWRLKRAVDLATKRISFISHRWRMDKRQRWAILSFLLVHDCR